MKKTILVLLFITGFVYPQDKYLIYFKDKGVSPNGILSKSSSAYQSATSILSERALKRRMRVLPEDSLITYEDLPIWKDYKKKLSEKGISIKRELRWFNAVSAILSKEKLELVQSMDFVKKVEPVKTLILKDKFQFEKPYGKFLSKGILDDSANYGYSYEQLKLSDIPVVHSRGIHGEGVIIGLLDTGFDWKNHQALSGLNVIKEYDFVFGDSITANQSEDASDQDSHGTYVFSIIGGYDPGNFLGAAYRSSYILAKTEDIRTGSTEDKHYEEDNFASALEWMESMGVDITSSSLGYNAFVAPEKSYSYCDMNGQTTIVTKAAELAFRRGVVVIQSAGNEGDDPWRYITAPADGFNVVAVGAVYSDNQVTSFSGRGPTADGRIKPDVLALGSHVYGATAHSKLSYTVNSGTSAACPIVGGTAALLLSAFPYLNNIQVRSILLESGDNSATPNLDRGYGLVSAVRTIEFPNLEFNGNNYIIHKAFLNPNEVKQNSLKMYYRVDKEDYNSVAMTQTKEGFFQADLPVYVRGNKINFYFEYKNPAGNIILESFDKNYQLIYGYMSISRNVRSLTNGTYPDDFVLGQNYPNPFNSFTRIDYKAANGEKAELIIMNSIGQTVKYINRTSEEGVNSLIWNGKTEDGSTCASGVYYYILRLSGKEYGKKMILLK